jgi:hypothetical protein
MCIPPPISAAPDKIEIANAFPEQTFPMHIVAALAIFFR